MSSVSIEPVRKVSGNRGADLVEQLHFFETDAQDQVREAAFSDPAFMSNKVRPLHRWVPWIAGFSGEFVDDILNRYMKRSGMVLDPFSGVGTTLAEAVLHGHEAMGFEINPYAALASKVKANAHKVDERNLDREILRFSDFYRDRMSGDYSPESTPPPGFRTRSPFYSPRVMRKVLIVWDFIKTVDETAIQDLFRLAFAATMVGYSNYSYEPSLGRRVSAGKPEVEDAPVGQIMVSKLMDMKDDIGWFKESMSWSGRKTTPKARVLCESFFRCREHVTPETVDLLITSPPYMNNYHYIRNTRPQLYWLGFINQPSDMKTLEQNNFGTYWQTAREVDRIDLEFTLPRSELHEQLDLLRGLNPEKGIYGGNGWANYAAAYFNDCYRFAQNMKYVLRPGGVAVIVIGNSILQGVPIPTDQYLAAISELVGLELVNIDIPRATRMGNSIINSEVRVGKANSRAQLYEAVVELRNRR